MSVTFSVGDAVVKYEDRPCDFPGCVAENRCGYCQDGVESVRASDTPECNFANGNATALLRLLGLPADACGDVAAKDVPAVLRRCLAAINVRGSRAHLLSEPYTERGTRGATAYFGGNTDDQTLSRLTRMAELLMWASQNGKGMSWS